MKWLAVYLSIGMFVFGAVVMPAQKRCPQLELSGGDDLTDSEVAIGLILFWPILAGAAYYGWSSGNSKCLSWGAS